MKIPAIKQLVETYTLDQLRQAEEAFYEEQTPAISIEGADEGEQLTHTIAAIWILEKMQAEGSDFKTALRAYTQRVRASIS
ncbi:DUF6952 family protein [Eisenibacter elegans]|jgi:hypothetical protein|uniref:DUF6952 family protein n=1 Tax=Eisenibacter elegans TaxID=997 RepID=UPI00042048A7|nr:hypothetical protein [Eisenibacter elegans]